MPVVRRLFESDGNFQGLAVIVAAAQGFFACLKGVNEALDGGNESVFGRGLAEEIRKDRGGNAAFALDENGVGSG